MREEEKIWQTRAQMDKCQNITDQMVSERRRALALVPFQALGHFRRRDGECKPQLNFKPLLTLAAAPLLPLLPCCTADHSGQFRREAERAREFHAAHSQGHAGSDHGTEKYVRKFLSCCY